MAEKMFYTMGEVVEMFDVNASLIRYWGTQFPSLKPQRNKKGNRLFTPEDIETLKRIYHYVKERGMTLEGAKKALRGDRSSTPEVDANVELLSRLQSLKSMLLAVRDSLGSSEQATIVDNDIADTEDVAPVQTEPVKVEPTEVEPEIVEQLVEQTEVTEEAEVVEVEETPEETEEAEETEETVDVPQRPVYREQTLFDL